MKATINYFLSVVLILISIALFSSCSSNELKNDEATALVSQLPNELVKGNIEVLLGTSSYWEEQTNNDFYSKNAQLIQRGILLNPQTYNVRKPGEPLIYRIQAEFTDSAKSLILGGNINGFWNQKFVVKCGELKFIEIVGVFQEENSKTAEIEYKVAFIPTMFANYSKMNPKYEIGQTYSKKKNAKKYDNGWRIEN